MISEIRLYCEGGGDGRATQEKLRDGLREFLKSLRDEARQKKIRFEVMACGSRNETFDKFKTARRTHTTAFNVLLVDAEEPLAQPPWRHLRERDGWNLQAADERHCHLMVQTTEAWIVADVEALKHFYQKGFNAKAIPKNPDVERINKAELARALKNATRRTNKGEYHKTRHTPELLKKIAPAKVRKAARHCDRLFDTLTEEMSA